MRNPRRFTVLGLAAIAAAATACGGVTHGNAPLRSASPARSGMASREATPSAKVPNPFTIIARYTAGSLGFSTSLVPQSWDLHDALDLAVGPDDNVYMTEASQRVTVVSSNGKVLRRWGEEGKGPGQFEFSTNGGSIIGAGIAVGQDRKVYVGDSGNHRVEVFSSAGTFLQQFGSFGDEPGQFEDVSSLAVDADGGVYVGDDTQGILSKFSPTGSFKWRIGDRSSSDPYLRGGFHVRTVDSHDRVVATVGDSAGEGIVYLDSRGRRVDVFETDPIDPSFFPCGVTVNSVGYTVVTDCPDKPPLDTLVFDRTHQLVGAWYDSHLGPISFGPRGELFALGDDGSILKLKVALPGA